MYTKIADCRMCYSPAIVPVLDLGTQALTGIFPKSPQENIPAGPLGLVKCTNCGLVQLEHNYDLSMLYGHTYGYRSGLNRSMVQHLYSKVEKIRNMVRLDPGDLVVDIGSNDGTLLSAYPAEQGLRLIGMDPSGAKFQRYYAAHTELVPDFFSARAIRKRMGGQKAKVVTSIAMFYDLERPIRFVEEVIETLDPEGLWVFEQSYLPSMLATNSYDTVCHEHLEYYALKQIVFFTEKLGLKIVEVELNTVNGGSFSVMVAKRESSYPEAGDAVARILAQEEAGGFATTAPLERFKLAMERHRTELKALLEEIRHQGKRVFGYGASTKGNVLLQYCGIDSGLLPYIGEVNEDKFGSFTPGTRIPIIPELEARAMRPDYFLVLPWHFRDGIVKKEQAYLEAGGRLIFPLPKLEVVSKSPGPPEALAFRLGGVGY
jgi:NDP-4-keto-2,6-dideoxyhexose 3-C-methyltransferase